MPLSRTAAARVLSFTSPLLPLRGIGGTWDWACDTWLQMMFCFRLRRHRSCRTQTDIVVYAIRAGDGGLLRLVVRADTILAFETRLRGGGDLRPMVPPSDTILALIRDGRRR